MDEVWITQQFGMRLRDIRTERGVKQEQLARRAGLSRTSVVNIEKGRQGVALSTLYRLAEALELQPGDLLPPPRTDDQQSGLTVAIGGRPEADAHVLREVFRNLDGERDAK